MTKDHGKRKIEIEDKRKRDEAAAQAPEAAVDDALLRQFTPEGQADAPQGAAPAPAGPDGSWEQKAAEYLDLAQRKEAELRNYRKRVAQDLDDARRFAVEGLLSDLFPALDGLAQAVHAYKAKPDGEDPLLDGVRRTVRALENALLKHGVEKITQAGVPFDPHLHHALNVEESAEVTEETVAELYVEGYKMGEMVLKPAMVRVLKPAS
jgi:molecular chaperone GrpE